MNNKTIDKRMRRIDCILESCESPDLRELYQNERTKLGKEKIKNCNELLIKVMNQESSGLITESTAEELINHIDEVKTNTLFDTYPWYEDAATAAGLHIAKNELAALMTATVSLIPSSTIGKVITAPVRKFIMSRLSKYTMLHTDAVTIKDLKSEKYDLDEMKELGFNFQHAYKWLDRGISRVHVILYSYKGKHVMGIAFTKDIHAGIGMNGLIEPVIKDASFKKHQDYYTAIMCVNLQLTHPAISRVLKKLKGEWKEKVDSVKRDIEESVEESLGNGTHDERVKVIMECAEDGRLDPDVAKNYLDEVHRAEYRLDR